MSESASSLSHKWRDLIRRQQASGLSVAAFCRQNRIAESSFFAWKRRVISSPVAPAFVEAKVTASLPAVRAAGVLEIRLRGGRRVLVHAGFDRNLLAELITVLEGLA